MADTRPAGISQHWRRGLHALAGLAAGLPSQCAVCHAWPAHRLCDACRAQFARPGARCRHNLNYWEFGDYLGLGPGAHGKLSFHDRIVREARLRSPESWMRAAAARDGSHLAESRQVGPDELPFEFMLNALRLKDGVAATLFNERTGLSLAAIAHQLEAAAGKGLLDADPTRLRATPLGWRFLNDLQEMFL